MRKIAILSVIVSFSFFSCDQRPKTVAIPTTEKNEVSQLVDSKNKESVQMKVEGMVCAMGCAKFIEDKVADLDGVVLSKVDFETETASFEFDQSVLSAAQIETFIYELHNGQYKATVLNKEKTDDTKNEEVEKKEIKEPNQESITQEQLKSVRENFNFSFPELFTYFLKRI